MEAFRKEFKEAIGRYRHQAYCGRHYVDHDGFFAAHLTGAEIKEHLKRLFPDEPPNKPVEAYRIVHAYRKTFSILLLIGKGELIHPFVNDYDYSDDSLPHSIGKLRRVCVEKNVDTEYAEMFQQEQWQFLSDPLEINRVSRRQQDHVLPFAERRLINDKSGHALLWDVLVPEKFVGDKIKEQLPHAYIREKKGYRFALKQFLNKGEQAWTKEVKAFGALQNHRGVIRCLAHWQQKMSCEEIASEHRQMMSTSELHLLPSMTSYNILLEYGERDLEVYFSKVYPPIFASETTAFWTEMCSLLRTVQEIHQWHPKESSNDFNGLHSDIKPDNLLWVFETSGPKLKLADLGLFRYQKAVPDRGSLRVDGGTRTYSAPELYNEKYSPSDLPQPQLVDIWSLGCVFSIAVSFVVGGITSVESFARLRQLAFRKLGHSQWPPKADFFHDCKSKVLPEVLEWHEKLKNHTRKDDRTTRDIIDVINDYMLTPAPQRLRADQLVLKFEEILARAPQDSSKESPLIAQSLLETDQGADQRSSNAYQSASAPNRQASTQQSKKARAIDKSMRSTVFREATLRRAMPNAGFPPVPIAPTPALPVLQQTPVTRLDTVQEQSTSFSDRLDQTQRASMAPSTPSAFVGSEVTMSKADLPNQTLDKAAFELSQVRDGIAKHPRHDPDLAKCLINRDIEVLIDNGSSMERHWSEVQRFMDVLIWKTRELDHDGIGVSFTCANKQIAGIKYKKPMSLGRLSFARTNDIAGELLKDNIRPSQERRGTQMGRSLGEMFTKYEGKPTSPHHRAPKYLTIIVLTDGIWGGMQGPEEKDAIKDKISGFVDRIYKRVPTFNNAIRPVSIQFVHFGDEDDVFAAEARRRLDSFDNDWPEDQRLKKDVVDTEPISGNVYKMISGSFDPLTDQQDNTSTSGHRRNISTSSWR